MKKKKIIFIVLFFTCFYFAFSQSTTYCSSSGRINGFTDVIRNVQFGAINNDSPSEDNGYSDYTNISTIVARDTSYDLSAVVETDGNFTYYTYAWIDWNQNGDFSDAGEQYDLGTIRRSGRDGEPTANSPLSILVPSNAEYGSTRMRVATSFSPSPGSCDTLFDGEVEDYTVKVSPYSSYCISYGNGNDGYSTGITSVNFNTINNSTPIEDNAYSDFTDLSTSVNKGETYNLSVNVNTDGDYVVYTRAWFDWNQDGDFGDAGEVFDLGTTQNSPNGSTSNSPLVIAIPSDAVTGPTRVRISAKWQTYPTDCETGFDGEVEEYTINIIDSTITTGTISPSEYCTGTSISIPYTITGSFNSANIFTAQLSDENGSFASPIDIGTINSNVSGSIIGTIPAVIVAGRDYKVRVISNNPAIIGSNSPNSFSIKETPASPIANNNGPVCNGANLNLTASSIAGANYTWSGPNGFTSTEQNPIITQVTSADQGIYSVTATVNGCTGAAGSTTVNISPNNWTGAIDTNWNDAGNWSCNMVPNINTDVIIPAGLTNYPILETGPIGTVKDFSIEAGTLLQIMHNSFKIAGDHLVTNSNIDATNGTIIYSGNQAQSIPAALFLNNRINNLNIENPISVDLSGLLEVTGIVKVETGNLNSNGFLTLVSDSVQTALIDGTGNGEVLGIVNMQRYLENSFGYKYFSSPFSNTTVGDFSGYVDLSSSFPHFYSYNEARETGNNEDVSGWTAYTTSTNPINTLEGYALNFGNSSTSVTVEISGEVNNGAYARTLQNSNGLYTEGFNLVGNPYPSPIDWNAASGWTKQNIDDAIYFFTAGSTDQYSGTYTSYVNGISSSPVSNEGIIPSMQGFFVKVSDGFTTGNLGLTNEVRNLNFDQQFYKKANDQKTSSGNESLIRLSANYDGITSKDATVIYFSSGNRPEFEKEKDALKLMNTEKDVPNLYSLDPDHKKLSINGTQLNSENGIIRIPLGIEVKQNGWMQISLADLENLNYGFIYLLDKHKRTGQDLRKKPDFKFYTEEGSHESRFELVLSQSPITDPAEAFEDRLRIINTNAELLAAYDLEDSEKGWLQVINLNGQILEQFNIEGQGQIKITNIKSSGLYLFSLVTERGRHTKKIVVKL